jgi:type II secretory pathway component PulC
MLDFLVCSLLLFVIGTGGKETRVATSAPAPVVHEEFSPAAIQAQQDEWNRDYEQQQLLTQLQTQTSESEQLRARLEQTTTTLSKREDTIKTLSAEKTKVEQDKQAVEQSLSTVATQLAKVNEERVQLEKEGKATKESLAKLQGEQTKLQQQESELRQRAAKLDQTVTTQAETIKSLTDSVAASQSRIEQQLGTFAREQQQMVAALTESVQGLQAGLGTDEQSNLMQLVADVAKSQKKLQSDMDEMMREGSGAGIADSLSNIQAGQDALRLQTAKLAEQIESIKARGPGPYQAVKSARLELQVGILKRYTEDGTTSRFKGAAYPPAVRVDGKTYVVANYQSLGFAWGALAADSPSPGTVTELKYTATRKGEPAWSAPLTLPACVLKTDARVVAVPLEGEVPGLTTLELAAPGAAFQAGAQNKLHIFKSTVAGLSFEVETTPEMTDSRYLLVKRTLRGVASWFENPAYRPDTGDYMVTADGKLIGIMISRDKCFLLSKDDFQSCALSVPLADKQQFQNAIGQYPKVR